MTLVLRKSREELAKAEKAYLELIAAQSVEQAEQAWLKLIHALEHVWYKTLNNMTTCSRFQGWSGKYVKLRRSDELLAYLKNARDADTHTISEPVGVDFENTGIASLEIIGADGSTLRYVDVPHIKKFLQKQGLHDNTVVHVDASNKSTTAARLMRLNIIHNRSRSYRPPTTHLSNLLVSNDPVSVAKLALEFYTNFVNEVEVQFQNEGI